MRKKEIYFLAVILLTVSIGSGCAQLKEKFVPKPKDDGKKMKSYYAVRQYDVKPNLDLYTKRYIFWKNWHRDLLDVLTASNQKKKVVAIEQEISNLIDMRNMLVDEKAEELQGYITELEGVEVRLKKERITSGNEVRIRRQLENAGRQIKMKFSYNKMGLYIRAEFRGEEPDAEN
ncbi:MAG: hypothetical protein P9L88_03180 [Candidatus Tantalella remota]|nr:hypothetical protein [Candidatus Tantalella remota]